MAQTLSPNSCLNASGSLLVSLKELAWENS